MVVWPRRPLFWLGDAGSVAIVALWIVTRTEGTLVGPEPHEPEPVGVADGVATGLEIGIVSISAMAGAPGVIPAVD